MRVGWVIGNVATGVVVLFGAASFGLLVSVWNTPLVNDDSGADFPLVIAPDDRLVFAIVIPFFALLALAAAFRARDHLLVRALVTLGAWLVTVICAVAVANGGSVSMPQVSVSMPKLPSLGPAAQPVSELRPTRVQLLGRMLAAGLRVEVNPYRWPSPSLRAFALETRPGGTTPFATRGAPFVAFMTSESASTLKNLLARDGFTIRGEGASGDYTFVIADAPGATPASPARVRAIGRALRGEA
jgi:hypothetical protein